MPAPRPRIRERRALGTAVRMLRAQHALTQEEVERRGGLGAHSVSRIESGRRAPGWDSLVGLAEGLGVSVGELAGAYERVLADA